ncbi:MAG: hypothetical protein JWQ07_2305 [Ramlibacter sp.]|nr:hypothetical protein [Ramlibacter sp.]
MRNFAPSFAVRRLQRGISLLFALMSLVILGFAAVALTRSVDTGILIMGNLAFKQDTLVSAGSGAEQAITWIQNNINTGVLDSDHTDLGYYASSLDKLDPTGNKSTAADPKPLVNWDGSCQGATSGTFVNCSTLPFTGTAVNGNKIQWVITRLCDSPGSASGSNLCIRPVSLSTASSKDRGELLSGGRISVGTASPYFRVIVRVEGPRGTLSYTESMVHF